MSATLTLRVVIGNISFEGVGGPLSKASLKVTAYVSIDDFQRKVEFPLEWFGPVQTLIREKIQARLQFEPVITLPEYQNSSTFRDSRVVGGSVEFTEANVILKITVTPS